ncbi:MAG: hypothetical protein QM817_04310 [Archangium sp.]
MWTRRIAALMAALAGTVAHAFSIETSFTTGCHERISVEALKRAGWPRGEVEPPADAELQQLIANLPFHVPQGSGPWLTALIIGVRSNDLHGVAPTDFPEFAQAQLAEEFQEEHCLRAAAEDFVSGDVDALSRCEQFVRARLALAHGPNETIDLDQTESVRIALLYQDAQVDLPRFAYRLGQAMHAVQDSFTHTLRAPTSGPVLHVFNFVDPALRPDYFAGRDGFGHLSKLDGCESEDPLERERVEQAIEASAQLLRALKPASLTREQRLLDAADRMQPVLRYQSGCSPDNDWCGVAQLEGAVPKVQGCSTTTFVPALGLLALLLVRRRRRAWGIVAALGLVVALPARASPFGAHVGVGASIDRAAMSVELGARLSVHPRVTLGLDVEFNPWFNLLSTTVAPGVMNAYASGTWKWLETDVVTLRSTLKLGTSVLLFDVVGARAGSVGVFAGASLLAVSLQLRPGTFFTIDPLEVDLAVPSLAGVPLVVRQYRLSIGLEQRF